MSGSKNAALPLLFSTLLTRERCVLRNVPALADIRTAHRGARATWARASRGAPTATTSWSRRATCTPTEAPYELVKTMRASFLVLGPLLARFGHARVSTPGGCAIGARPVDLHLAGLEKMGARLRISRGLRRGRGRAARAARRSCSTSRRSARRSSS